MFKKLEYEISFGSIFSIDQFGFVRKGKIIFYENEIELFGYKHWSLLYRIISFFLITFLLSIFLYFLGFFLILITFTIVHYFCVSKISLKFNRSEIKEVNKKGRKITFMAPYKKNCYKRSIINAVDKEEAKLIESNF